MSPATPNLSRRLASASGALLLQGVFLLLLLYSTPRFAPTAKLEHEMMLILPRLQAAPPMPLKAAPLRRKLVVPALPSPGINGSDISPPTSAAPIVPPAAIKEFGQMLNNCAPENYANLPKDQRAKCRSPGAGVAIQELPNLMGSPSPVKDEAHWQEELARKQSPALLPCGGFIDVVCFLAKIADGTWTDYGNPSTWPRYAVKQLRPEDFYKIEKEYDAWHKDHSAAPGASVGPTANPAKN